MIITLVMSLNLFFGVHLKASYSFKTLVLNVLHQLPVEILNLKKIVTLTVDVLMMILKLLTHLFLLTVITLALSSSPVHSLSDGIRTHKTVIAKFYWN